jgi:hypothetical protein
MKNKFLTVASILSTLAMLAVAVTPAAAAGDKSITFLGAQWIPGKGVVFEFKVVGDFSDLSGFVNVGGQQFNLNCHFNGKENLACMANRGLSHFVGQIVQGSIAGYNFSGLIRGRTFCYSVFDYYPTSGPPENWHEIGQQCQDSPASPGDTIQFFNPDYNYDYNYRFSIIGGLDACLAAPDLGDGYYYFCQGIQ